MQICSKLFTSNVSKPKMSRTPMLAPLSSWSPTPPACWLDMLSFTCVTMKSNAAPYVAFMSASHAFSLCTLLRGLWTTSFPARMARYVNAYSNSRNDTPSRRAADTAEWVSSMEHASDMPCELDWCVAVNVMLPQCRMAAIRRKSEEMVSDVKPMVTMASNISSCISPSTTPSLLSYVPVPFNSRKSPASIPSNPNACRSCPDAASKNW
mmetsp:Transcript_21073/g.50850  ORF Transcript_21073/g.50850 Transcript_21073/m.50850 type:complete len:209 (-) Transcript_21073:573-1199(-)